MNGSLTSSADLWVTTYEEDLIRRFLDGMRVELRGRCSVVTYTSLEDLVEKAAVQEKCMGEEQKFSKAVQPKAGGASGSQKRPWEQTVAPVVGVVVASILESVSSALTVVWLGISRRIVGSRHVLRLQRQQQQ